jgi:hypothetical protein
VSNATGEDKVPSPVGFSDEEVEALAVTLSLYDFEAPYREGETMSSRYMDAARAVLTHLRARGDAPVQTGAVGSVPGWKLVPLEPDWTILIDEGIDTEAWHRLLAAMPDAPIQPASVPEGWKMVPSEPTTEIAEAARYWAQRVRRPGQSVNYLAFWEDAYRAMLAASPSPPALEGVGGGWQDISTAPKHTEVIVAQPVGDAFLVGEAMLRTEDSEVPAWWWANTGPGDAGNDGPIYGKGPTHWMAMPSPPNCTEERGAVSGQDSSFRTCALEPTGAGANSTTPIPSVDDGRG